VTLSADLTVAAQAALTLEQQLAADATTIAALRSQLATVTAQRDAALAADALDTATIADLTAKLAAATQPVPAPVPVPTPTGQSWVDHIGIACHLHYSGTPGAASPAIKAVLGSLGVKHIRDGWGIGWNGGATPDPCDAFMRDLFTTFGIKITFVCDPRDGGVIADRVKHLSKLASWGVLDAIEMPNEWDGARFTANGWSVADANWVAQLRSWCNQIIPLLKGDPAAGSVPIVAPSMASTNDTTRYTAVGPIAGLGFGNTHDYPGKDLAMNATILAAVKKNSPIIAPGVPIVATETGFSTLAGDWPAVTPQQQADKTVDLLTQHRAAGLARTFIYKLAPSNAGWRDGLALVNNDLSPKPVFTAVKTLVTV
jgi:hypothetical protein